MKKKILTLISIIALVLGLSALIVACGDEKVEYSATVVTTENEPISGVTVSWMKDSKVSGTATTNDEGVAKASLPAGTYFIALSGDAISGYDYDEDELPVPTADERDVEIELSVKQVTYTVTVKDKYGYAVKDVAVTWSNGSQNVTETTDANGKAQCKLDYGEYTVSLDNNTIPEGNVCDEALKVKGSNPSVTFNLRAPRGDLVDYTVTVRSSGNLLFRKTTVTVNKTNNATLTTGETDEDGVFTFRAEVDTYIAGLTSVPEGYDCEPVTLTSTETSKDIILSPEAVSARPALDSNAKYRYVMGDIFHNYRFTTPYELKQYKYELNEEGEPVIATDEDGNDIVLSNATWSKTVSQILQEKEVLIINNWGTNCSWCLTEMPDMDTIYKKYCDQIELVAVSNYSGVGDSDTVIRNYYDQNGYSFPMVRDANGFTAKFGIRGWPTTVVIDRYGAVARIEEGAITSLEAWERLIEKYIGEDYEQNFTFGAEGSDSIVYEIAEPDIKFADLDEEKAHHADLGEKLLNGNLPTDASITWYGEKEYADRRKDEVDKDGNPLYTEYKYAWPFLVAKFDNLESGDDYVMFASNGTSITDEENYYGEREGKANSMSFLYADVTVQPGQALTFQYFTHTQAGADILYILWDGRIIREFSGDSKGWKTCYLYSEITAGEHTLSITYIKDTATNFGKDNVFIRNLSFVDVMTIEESTDMFRGAGYGEISGGKFTHYVDAAIAADGYYHVDVSKLEKELDLDEGLAGNDDSPLLFANLTNRTAWNNYYSINELVYMQYQDTGNYVVSCEFDLDGKGKKDYRDALIRYLKAATASDVTYCVPVDATLQKLLAAFMKEWKKTERILAKMDVSDESKYWHENEWLEICYFYSHYGNGKPVGNPILGLMEETAIKVELNETAHADLTRVMAPYPFMIFTFTPDESAVYKIESLLSEEESRSALIWLYDNPTEFANDHYLVYSGEYRVNRDAKNEQNFEVYYYMTAGQKYYIRLAFVLQASGGYDFEIAKIGPTYTELTPASADIYTMILDDKGDWTGATKLAGAVDYELREDGFYHVKNSNSADDLIYLDVEYANTAALGTVPLKRLYNYTDNDPFGNKLDYTMFDFRYYVGYHWETVNGEEMATYDPTKDNKIDISKLKYYDEETKSYILLSQGNPDKYAKYKDYTDILKGYIDKAPTSDDDDKVGLIPVTPELVDILTAYMELRLNAIFDDVIEFAQENEWLRFCWCYTTHDETHP